MRNKGDEQFYHRLSRKELQCLCKKYGLPANKSSSEMAKSLALYFENMSSMSSGERLGCTQDTLLPTMITGLQPGAKDNNGLNSCSTEMGNRSKYSQTVRSNELGYCIGDKTCDKEGIGCSMYCSAIAIDGRVEDMCSIQHKEANIFPCTKENASSSAVKTIETTSPSFEFYVCSEEGINLCVDLNSNPSDWIKKLKSEVNICENMCHNKSPSFHQELGRFGESNKQTKSSFLWNIDAHQSKDDNMQSESSPSILMKENNHVVLDHSDGGDGSLTSVAIKSSGFSVVVSERAQEDQGVILSEPNSDARDGIHSCTDENGCVTTLDSEIGNSPRKELAGNSTVDNTLDYPSGVPSFEHQNSKPTNEICDTQDNSCSLVDSQLVVAGCRPGSSAEIPLSGPEIELNASCVPSENGEFLDLVYPTGTAETEQSRLADSSEPNFDICMNHLPTSVEGLFPIGQTGSKTNLQERSKVIEVGEGSESSQYNGSFEKTCSSLDNMESSEELVKKRSHVETEDRATRGKPDAKSLRSLKHCPAK
ncbi:Chromatin structure-remodeling complex subunit like [Melia azedarach]|nr:Chromatin structure-remodeling complex subunit like [Melia azedarach]